MSSTSELEALLKKAVTLLQSSHASSATELRLLLDEEIKKRYGPEKTLTNNMTKKQLEEEANFPGRSVTPQPQPIETEEVINLVNSPAKTISDDSDDAVSGGGGGGGAMLSTAEDEANLKEFGDLNCYVCGEMMFTATNRLIECSRCGALYHQDCHKPPITDEEASEDQWQCDNCATKPTTSKASGNVVVVPDEPMPLIATSVASIKSKSSATSSRSSSSSNSSSPFYKMEQPSTPAPSKSSAKSHKDERSSVTGASISSKISSSLNAPSSSSSSSSSKKHSSSSSSSSKTKSSKHHDSKRKSSK
ncbi:integrator complex subunit 12 [Haematobia irritans]|uniref:integrator complex subunit 12 n=1 Tax=Haematobia irritans TaxID=7368 RepID=UPI003F507522